MRISNNNIFNQIFVVDPADLELFAYEGDIDTPRILVSKTPETKIQNFGDHVNIIPFEWQSEEQFNLLAIQALLKSCEISNSIVSTINEVQQLFSNRGLEISSRALISKNKVLTGNEAHELFKFFGEYDKYYNLIHKVDGLADHEMMFISYPEFLGVISCAPDKNSKTKYDEEYQSKYGKGAKDELYGIGVINTNAAVLVRNNPNSE